MPFSAERLKQARQRANLTQEQVGQRLGVLQQQVGKWENGVSAPGSETLARLAQLLGCTTDWLLELVDAPDDHLHSTDLSEEERELITLFRRGALPNLIQRLVLQLAEGNLRKESSADEPDQPDVPPEEIAANR